MASSPSGRGPTDRARGRAVCLALSPDPVLAFLHLPESPSPASTAVLICPPFGWEETCSYRGRRAWAQALARAGYPSARLDLPGAGDSGGSPADPGRLDAWTDAVSGTAAWLREATGCDRLAAIGIGLGGMVAYRAAAQGAPIDDLVLWAVPSRGRSLLRELRAHAAVVAAGYPEDAPTIAPPPDAALSLNGFLMSAETAGELGDLKLTALHLPRPDTRRALLMGRDDIGIDVRLQDHLAQAGVAVTVAASSDHAKLMAQPQEAETPVQTIAATITWLGDGATGVRMQSKPGRTPAVERPSLELLHSGERIRETPLSFEVGEVELFGMLCEPAPTGLAGVCAVLLNAGALRRVGPNRTWVEIARRWAARGVPSLRLDLDGIGDSDGDERRVLSNQSLYASRRNEETLAVLDQLAERGLPGSFVLAGLCSGAYGALHAALAEPRVAGAFMINLYSFFWSEELVAERETQDALAALRRSSWRRLATRDVSADQLRTAMRTIRPSRLRTGARRQVERSHGDQVNLALDRLRDQGTEALLLLCDGEPLRDQLARQGQLDHLERWPNLSVERIPSRDHLFRAFGLQQGVHRSLDRALDRVLERARSEQPQAQA